MQRARALAPIALLLLAACAAPGGSGSTPAPAAPLARTHRASPIQHVIVIVQDGRTFENLFAGYPGADAPLTGLVKSGKRIALHPITFAQGSPCSPVHNGFAAFATAVDGGKMDGFSELYSKNPTCAYSYVERSETKPYWDLAKQYTLADHAFASTYLGDFVNRQYSIAGSTKIAPDEYVAGNPSNEPWGCDAPPGTTVPALQNGKLLETGPFPCFNYASIAQSLDASNVSWRYYVGRYTSSFAGEIGNAFDAIKAVRDGPDWNRDFPLTARVFSDLKNGTLSNVSWVIPNIQDSDSSAVATGHGPAWVAKVVAAAKASRYWQHLAIVVVWADPGPAIFYDNVPPPQLSPIGLGLGFRVPMLVISPYAKHGYVSHTVYENGGSVLRFIEATFGLATLNTTDVSSNSLDDCFTF